MAASLGDLLQVVDKQSYLGQEILNVYMYRVTSITGLVGNYLELIAEWFNDNVVPAITPIQVDVLTHTSIEARNLSNNLDFFELPSGLTGEVAAASDNLAPSFVTVGFQLIRESLATRNGYKRFSGLNDLQIQGNLFIISPADADAIEAALASDIVLSLVTVAEPVIVRRPITPPVAPGYVYSSIGSAIFRGLGTQNTRKPD